MPAIAEEPNERITPNKNDKRKPGEALWPSKYPISFLDKHRKADSRDWAALYQQSPYTEGGAILKKHWWKFYTTPPKFLDEVGISVDATFKDLKTSDYVVIQTWGRKGPDKYLLDQYREKMDYVETEKATLNMRLKWRQCTKIWIEDKANGSALISRLRRKITGVIPVEPEGSKIARAQAVAPQVESGNTYLPDPSICDWVNDFIDECAKFPNAKHDDQVDACSQALARLETSEGLDIAALTEW